MPTHGTPQIQGEDEVTTKGTDKSEQRLGIWEEEAEVEGVHKRLGWVLSPCQYEAFLPWNRWMVKAADTHVYMEGLEEAKDESSKPH